MVVDDLFGVIHTAVTDFDGVAVKYLTEAVILRPQTELRQQTNLPTD